MRCVVLTVIFFFCSAYCMTEQQMKATGKLVRNVCQPKSKTTDEIILAMHEGNWDFDQTGKCYLWCVINYLKMMNKDNTFNFESASKQVATIPEERKAPTNICLEQCKDSIKTLEDKCEAAYEITKCIYFCNPSNYFLP